MNRYFLTLLIFVLLLNGCKDSENDIDPIGNKVSPTLDTYPVELATEWQDLHLQLIKSTAGFVPPVAARSLAYANLALYESSVHGTANQSLAGQIALVEKLPIPDKSLTYNWGISTNAAQYHILKNSFSSTSAGNLAKINALYSKFQNEFRPGTTPEIVDRSEEFGQAIADAIWEYSKQDNGHEAYKNVFPDYPLFQGLGAWKPVGNQKALLPRWAENVSLVRANLSTDPPPPLPFSYNANSDFFKEAKEIYDLSKNLTQDQRAIALFFADGGGTVTPPGHHMNVATTVIKQEKASLSLASETYVKLGLALNDAFIACWRCKYRFNLIRPITYIRETMDRNWTPIVPTPPFPEYTSGHSSGAGAAAEVLKAQFGENTAFTDDTYKGIYPSRSYTNFTDYADETSNSRLYGGIHYRRGCEEGVKNGRNIAKNIMALKFR